VRKKFQNVGFKVRYQKNGKWIDVRNKELKEETVNMLMYADDMVIICENIDDLKNIVIDLDKELYNAGMTMNVKKNKDNDFKC
jgi:hypothetical protein